LPYISQALFKSLFGILRGNEVVHQSCVGIK